MIDVARSIFYAVAWSSPDRSVARARFALYALRLSDGSHAQPPLDLMTAAYDAGHGLPRRMFAGPPRKQRASLLLTTVQGVTTVFVGFGSVAETGPDARGWVLACSTQPLALTAAWASTARKNGGGIWHAGGGLAADAAGDVYAMTGNGAFDGVTDFSESVIKLRYTPPGPGGPATLRIVDWWTPFSDARRTARDAAPPAFDRAFELRPLASQAAVALAEPEDAPTNYLHHKKLLALGMDEGWGDMDLASGGPVLVESIGALIASGKDGISYIVDTAAMGKTSPADLDPVHAKANYAKLKSPPYFFTYYWPGADPAPADIRSLNASYGGVTHHNHGTPVVWHSPAGTTYVYCWGENGNLRAWSLASSGGLTYLACSTETASPNSPVPPGGMPGGMICLSSDGASDQTGVVWALVPYADANLAPVAGRLLAYDATTFGVFPNGSKQLRVLWDSQRWNIPFTFNKFNRPVVWGGKLYVPTYDARVDVYGLA